MEFSLDPNDLNQEAWMCAVVVLEVLLVGKSLWLVVQKRKSLRDFACRCRCFTSWWSHDQSKFSLEEQRVINSRVRQARLVLAVSVNNYFLVLWLLVCLLAQISIFRGVSRFMSAQFTWHNVISLAFFCASFLVPSLLRPSTLDVWYVGVMLIITSVLAPTITTPAQSLLVVIVSFALVRIPAVLGCTRPWLVFCCEMGLYVVSRIRTTVDGDNTFESDVEVGAAQTTLWGWLLVSVAAVAVQRSLQNREAQGLLISNTTTELSAATSLLELTCDAVVELDSDLQLTSPGADIASLLLKDSSVSLQGKCFTDFVATSDEAERAEQLLRGSDKGVHTGAFHTRLVDSCSSKFRTEVFHVSYSRLGGQTRHLLGLRDFTDQASLAGRRAVDSTVGRGAFELEPHEGQGNGKDLQSLQSRSGAEETRHLVYVQIDMDSLQVVTASVRTPFFAGKPLDEIFGEAEMDFFQQVWQQVQVLDRHKELATKELTVTSLYLRWKSQEVCVSGRIEVTKQSDGRLGFLFCFEEPHAERSIASTPRSQTRSRSSSRSSRRKRSSSRASSGHGRRAGHGFHATLELQRDAPTETLHARASL
ncbi:rsmI [Symbiodinium sp. CCMP2456]|nr:rsmI [Symbiodinium sp. CCMP2456]